ncbi:GTP pyrophosphokinase family protein [Enterococcus sp.]|uniref:GTP pyrophosphokinase n=1 Tax=Enterococcus sp. TaxID=35783 RepID=UPI0029114C7D|nr:GTP pyrophosphokinase family protein [Enterococcus sp.]MDU5334388.1 GTP pyrophosphokinase family protein [Enterococcus sp.]
MERDWDTFLAPYELAVAELKIKLRGLRKQYRTSGDHVPIEFVTGRVKPVESILNKSELRGIPLDRLEEEMSDMAGMRIMCQFVEDIPLVVEILRRRNDMKIIQERDYITNRKASGYRSYHLVIEYPVQMLEGEKKLLAEIQIRTLSMNFWATIEHSMNYKYKGQIPEDIQERLFRAAEAAYQLDEEMSSIRGEIQEAQHVFNRKEQKKEVKKHGATDRNHP